MSTQPSAGSLPSTATGPKEGSYSLLPHSTATLCKFWTSVLQPKDAPRCAWHRERQLINEAAAAAGNRSLNARQRVASHSVSQSEVCALRTLDPPGQQKTEKREGAQANRTMLTFPLTSSLHLAQTKCCYYTKSLAIRQRRPESQV